MQENVSVEKFFSLRGISTENRGEEGRIVLAKLSPGLRRIRIQKRRFLHQIGIILRRKFLDITKGLPLQCVGHLNNRNRQARRLRRVASRQANSNPPLKHEKQAISDQFLLISYLQSPLSRANRKRCISTKPKRIRLLNRLNLRNINGTERGSVRLILILLFAWKSHKRALV